MNEHYCEVCGSPLDPQTGACPTCEGAKTEYFIDTHVPVGKPMQPPRAPQNVAPRAPQNVPPRAPQNVPPRAPQNVSPRAPQNVSPRAPQNVPPRAPQNVPPRAPQNVAPRAPQNVAPRAPQNVPPRAPQNVLPRAPQGASQGAESGNKPLVITLIAVGCVALIALAVALYFILSSGRNGSGVTAGVAVKSVYTDYLRDTLAKEVGVFTGKDPKNHPEGIYSARNIDYDKDGEDEFFAIYAKKKDDKHLEYDLISYFRNNHVKKTTEATTADNGTTKPTGGDSGENGGDGEVYHSTEEPVIVTPVPDEASGEVYSYIVDYDGRQYIFFERLEYNNSTYSYECTVFTQIEEELVEVANIFEPEVQDNAQQMVYSTKLFKADKIKNDDLDFSALEGGEELKEQCLSGERYILYCESGGEKAYVYDTYYHSKQEAISDFFADFGIKKEAHVIGDPEKGERLELNCDGEERVFRFANYPLKTQGDETTTQYEFTDYTRISDLMQNDSSKQSKKAFVYDEVIERYQEAMACEFNAYLFYQNDEEFFNSELCHAMQDYDAKDKRLEYALVDLNGDGVDEMLLGTVSGDEKEHGLYDLFTYADGKCVRLFDYDMGYRSQFTILKDNTIKTYGSGSAFSGDTVFYRLPASADHFEAIDAVGYDSREDVPYFAYAINGGKCDYSQVRAISESEYNAVLNQYGDDARTDFEWKQIKLPEQHEVSPEDQELFENMLDRSAFAWYADSADFENMPLEELIANYVMMESVPCGVYTSFNAFDFSEDCVMEYSDPQQKFSCAWKLDAEKVDWVIENVFERKPDHQLQSDSFYYEGDAFYRAGDLGGGAEPGYKVQKYTAINDEKVVFTVIQDDEIELSSKNTLLFVATLHDTGNEHYWSLQKMAKVY